MRMLTAARHEASMQLRRRGLWITFGVISALTVTMAAHTPWDMRDGQPMAAVVANWSIALGLFHPVAFGCLLADRLPRVRRLHVDELVAATPTTPTWRLLATYLGAATATLVPIVALWAVGIGVAAMTDPSAIPLGVAALLTINLPGLLFIAAFSVICPLYLTPTLYQFLFVGYYMWGNWISPDWGIPTLAGTWLTPVGGYASSGLFGTTLIHGGRATTWEALASIGLLLALTGAVLTLAGWWLSRAQTRWQRHEPTAAVPAPA